MEVEISDHHDELIRSLYDLRAQMLPVISRDERLIVEMAIQTLEYLESYAADIPMREYLKLPPEEQRNSTRNGRRNRKEPKPSRSGKGNCAGQGMIICA
jgi:hypothetical protein